MSQRTVWGSRAELGERRGRAGGEGAGARGAEQPELQVDHGAAQGGRG